MTDTTAKLTAKLARFPRLGIAHLPTPLEPLETLPHVVTAGGLPSSAFVRNVPWLIRPLARRIVAALGVSRATHAPANAQSLLHAALPTLREQTTGLIIIHWPDCDAIGHQAGWMSPAYLAAVDRMDHALGVLREELNASRSDTLLIALADHGGGGRVANHHNSTHPLDTTIPIFLEGAGLVPYTLRDGHSILDVSATALWALGLPIPAQYGGSPIQEPFARAVAANRELSACAA